MGDGRHLAIWVICMSFLEKRYLTSSASPAFGRLRMTEIASFIQVIITSSEDILSARLIN